MNREFRIKENEFFVAIDTHHGGRKWSLYRVINENPHFIMNNLNTVKEAKYIAKLLTEGGDF